MSQRVAVVGCGHWGKNLVRNFAELGCLLRVCDADMDLARDLADRYGVSAAEYDAICEDDEIDGVVIAAPAPLHAPLALKAFEAGKHVYVENPWP